MERELAQLGYETIVGVDEVGRGAWAGPLTVCAARWTPESRTQGVRDSKLLTPAQRNAVASRLREKIAFGIGHVQPAEIDEVGLTAATTLATIRAFAQLAQHHSVLPDVAILDGSIDFLDGICPTRCIIAADRRCNSVASASVLAKVTRDALMVANRSAYPEYDFASNKGYPSPAHIAALSRHGPCRLHRHSWAPIRALLDAKKTSSGEISKLSCTRVPTPIA